MMIEQVLHQDNIQRAYKRVVRNGGAAGTDGVTVDALMDYCHTHWSRIKEEIEQGTYRPRPVRKVEIPKPGGGRRMLGIPTAVDRMIQQALLQVLSPIFEPTFSNSSYGFRPGRSAHDAVKQMQEYIATGHRWVVDLDLEKFFDQVNHDILMSRVARRVKDKRVLLLIRRYLQAGMMDDGVVLARTKGTPQGGPLSPLLSNILLDDLDKELERRGHCFCRYADDVNVYVKSEKAGHRVMASIERFLAKRLRLRVNRDKSAVARPWKRTFLGYSVTSNLKPRLKVALRSIQRLKSKLKPQFRRGRGRNLKQVAQGLQPALRGWMNYFRLTEVKGGLEGIDRWLRRRLRGIQWRQWKKPRTRFKKLVARGVSQKKAARAAWGRDGPWASAAGSAMNVALPNKTLHEWGLLNLVDYHRHLECSV
jgi:RNA-directed DNA polymerase